VSKERQLKCDGDQRVFPDGRSDSFGEEVVMMKGQMPPHCDSSAAVREEQSGGEQAGDHVLRSL
jgi:hypothetical protein